MITPYDIATKDEISKGIAEANIGLNPVVDGDVVRRWAVAGLGIAYKSRLDILSDLRSGALVKLLPHYQTEQAPLYLLAVQRLSSSPVLKALSEFLLQKLRQHWQG